MVNPMLQNQVIVAPEKPRRYRGIVWHAGHQKWVAKTHGNGCYVTLGYYDDPEYAARVYDCAAKLIRGPDAVLNFDGLPPPDMTSAGVRDLLVRRGVLRPRKPPAAILPAPAAI
jgi:hypothetical protein